MHQDYLFLFVAIFIICVFIVILRAVLRINDAIDQRKETNKLLRSILDRLDTQIK